MSRTDHTKLDADQERERFLRDWKAGYKYGAWTAHPTSGGEVVSRVDAGRSMTAPGLKYDAGKAPWTLLMRGCSRALAGVVAVLQFGAKKYAPNSWQRVENAPERYRDALYRHLAEIERYGADAIDPETGLLHWYHVTCNAMFLTELAVMNAECSAREE